MAKKAEANGKNGLDGFLWTADCVTPATIFSDSCANFARCPAEGGIRSYDVQLGGTSGAVYEISMTIAGISEGKVYQDGQRRVRTELSKTALDNDGWYLGGTPQNTLWSSYELRVAGPAGSPNVYYLNSGAAATVCEGRDVFGFKYQASMRVMGQSRITFTLKDRNCHQMMNCGVPSSSQCSTHASLPLAEFTDPPPPSTFTQPYSTGPGNYGQWWLFDVTSVTQVPSP